MTEMVPTNSKLIERKNKIKALIKVKQVRSFMKILITGAAGFIGMHLCKKLLDLGFEVIGLDNINSYYDIKLKKNRLKNLYDNNKQFQFYEIDILDNTKLTNIFNDNDFDYVVHLAAQAGVRNSIKSLELISIQI